MNAELAALLALGQSRRAAGLPCNPHREGLANVDWLSLGEIDQVHALTLRIALKEKLAVGVAA